MKRFCDKPGCHYSQYSEFCEDRNHPYYDQEESSMDETYDVSDGVKEDARKQYGGEPPCTTIGPECFTNGEVISYKGENYVRQVKVERWSVTAQDCFEDGWVHIFIPEPITSQVYQILAALLPGWMKQFALKSADYQTYSGNVSENFGVLGQYMKLFDKIAKLRRPLWDDRIGLPGGIRKAAEFNFEDADEILNDLIGHAFLTKMFLAEERDREDRDKRDKDKQDKIDMSLAFAESRKPYVYDEGLNKSAPRPAQGGPK